MKRERLLAMALAVTLGFSLSACSGTSENNDAAAGTEVSVSESEALETGNEVGTDGLYVSEEEGGKTSDQFTIWVGKTSSAAEDTMTQKVMREELGIDYKCEFMQSNDVATTVNLRLSSGDDLPDMMVFPNDNGVERALIEADRVMKLNDIYETDKLKNIPNIDPRIIDLIRHDNGDIYRIPGWYDSNIDNPWPGWTTDAWYVNTKYMEAAGVTEEDISTLEGFEEALRKFAQLKDANGKPIIPMSMSGITWQVKPVLAAFGVDVVDSASGFPTVMEINGEFVPKFDNPGYKEAFIWLNKLYREGLLDMEVPTIQSERFKEKVKNGQIASWVPDVWSGDPYTVDFDAGDSLESIKLYYSPFQSPKVEGVEKAMTQGVDPYPKYMILINKDTKHLNAVLNFLDWCAEPNPIRQQEVNDGPEGVLWYFTDDTRTTWKYTEEYDKARASMITGTPELWWLSNYRNEWYPWWNSEAVDPRYKDERLPTDTKACQYIAENIVNHRIVGNIDLVKLDPESKYAQNRENLNAVEKEYQAKMLMAQTDAEFEAAYNEMRTQLETRAHWSELKQEWIEAYQEQYGN